MAHCGQQPVQGQQRWGQLRHGGAAHWDRPAAWAILHTSHGFSPVTPAPPPARRTCPAGPQPPPAPPYRPCSSPWGAGGRGEGGRARGEESGVPCQQGTGRSRHRQVEGVSTSKQASHRTYGSPCPSTSRQGLLLRHLGRYVCPQVHPTRSYPRSTPPAHLCTRGLLPSSAPTTGHRAASAAGATLWKNTSSLAAHVGSTDT